MSRQGAAVLNHPDQRSTWAIVVVAHLRRAGLDLRPLPSVAAAAPLVSARLVGKSWVAGDPPVFQDEATPLPVSVISRRFDLAHEPPFRVLRSPDALTLVGHHAAFDGLALLGVLSLLLGGDGDVRRSTRTPDSETRRGGATRGGGILRRLLAPAVRVPPSFPQPNGDSFATRAVTVPPGAFTARLAAATAAAVQSRLPKTGRQRMGISLAIGGDPSFENTASYRRVDVDGTSDVRVDVATALATAPEPRELQRAPRLFRGLAFLSERASDTFLISNLGAIDAPHVEQIDFYPVARGRSAVAIGAASVVDGRSTVSLRARDLSKAHADDLLDTIVERLEVS